MNFVVFWHVCACREKKFWWSFMRQYALFINLVLYFGPFCSFVDRMLLPCFFLSLALSLAASLLLCFLIFLPIVFFSSSSCLEVCGMSDKLGHLNKKYTYSIQKKTHTHTSLLMESHFGLLLIFTYVTSTHDHSKRMTTKWQFERICESINEMIFYVVHITFPYIIFVSQRRCCRRFCFSSSSSSPSFWFSIYLSALSNLLLICYLL